LTKKITFLLIFFLFFSSKIIASPKQKIINNLNETNNLSFEFKQKISKKSEQGKCQIEYPKLIYCLYYNEDKKEIISNGRTLVIKNNKFNETYVYPLKKTPLFYILDKDYILNEIKNLEPEMAKPDKFKFLISDDLNKIKIFFHSKTFNLLGWETTDIYQNKVLFEISNIKKNQKINRGKFKLPNLN